jgi:hypothetical protein
MEKCAEHGFYPCENNDVLSLLTVRVGRRFLKLKREPFAKRTVCHKHSHCSFHSLQQEPTMTVVTALFNTRPNAEEALQQLETAGVTADQISVVMTDDVRGTHFKLEEGNKIDEGAAAGATMGGIVGAVLAAVASAGVIVIPGLNLVVSGALAAGLAGLGAGAAAGGLVGGLIGAGIPEHEAKVYEKELKRGSILLAIKSKDSAETKKIKSILESHDGFNVAA